MKKIYFVLTLFLIITNKPTEAKNYIFFGTGEWTNTANWAGGLVPWTGGFTSADTITITGTTGVGVNCTFNCPFGTMSANVGTMIIATGGTFTFQNFAQFSNQGKIVVDGTMTNKTTMEMHPGSSIVVNGTLNNEKTIDNRTLITINSGGVINNRLTALFTNTGFAGMGGSAIGTLVINNGGTFNNTGTATLRAGNLTNNGTISNTSKLVSNATITGNLSNGGTLAPGDSPGLYTVTGDYTAQASAVHNFEVGGTAANNYDRLNVSGAVNLNGALNITLINGFNPTSNHDIPIISGNVTGTFSVVNKPSKYLVVYNSDGVVLRYISTLPVTFTSINAHKENNAVRVRWNITNESHVSTYEVERSDDGRNFRKIGEVVASSLNQYDFMDNNPGTKIFYRIKSVDFNGKFSYSSIVNFKLGKGNIALRLFPSITTGELTIQHDKASAAKLFILSADGRIVRTVLPARGVQQTEVDLSVLPSGLYFVRYENRVGEWETVKFAKQ